MSALHDDEEVNRLQTDADSTIAQAARDTTAARAVAVSASATHFAGTTDRLAALRSHEDYIAATSAYWARRAALELLVAQRKGGA
jgi:hypothetical protein